MVFTHKKNSREGRPRPRQRRGQNVTEYLILVAGVVAVVIVAAGSRGFFTQGVNKALNIMFDSVEDMATVQCLGTLDDVNGGWSSFGSWAPCTSCSQTQTRTCTNPAPKCAGSLCTLGDGTLGLIETESQSCASGVWVTGTCGTCTGNCGSASGTCTQAVICNGGCCDAASEPSSTASCTKLPYPDVWTGLGFGTCSASCGAGIASQTVTCSGMCCDAVTKPPTRQACADGCCAQSLAIGTDVVNGGDLMGTFGPAGNGASVTLTCPPGYAGSPTRACTAAASASCTGDDSYSPPSSCYTIFWGGLTGECQPASCAPWTTDIGTGVMGTFPDTLHNATAVVNCSDFDIKYQGSSSAECSFGAWQNLVQGCSPASCPAWTTDIGSGVTGTFPDSAHGTTSSLTCASIDPKYEGASSATCDYGSWIGLVQGCSPASCADEIFMDPNGFVSGTFPASPHGAAQTLTCAAIDVRYTGDFSRTCDYGSWISPTGGCTAQSCPDWITNSGGVNVTFTAAAHGTPQTQNCSDFDPAATGQMYAECAYGSWVNVMGGCTAFQCINQIFPSNATMCAEDNTGLTADTSWSVVGNGGCTAVKCQYECNFGYVKSGNNCVPAVCTGPGFSNATMCFGDNTGLTADTPNTLVTACGTPKCEYTCNSGYVVYNGACCQSACLMGSCGTQTVCGQSINCGSCCGNGAIDTGEQCDGTIFGTLNCASYGFTGNCGSLSCSADCASISTAGCRNAIPGTWTGGWVNTGTCGQFQTCKQRQRQTCAGASCGGTCPGLPPVRFVPCAGACCGDGVCNGSETCSTCPTDCGACCVPTTCAAMGLCNGGSTSYSDGCGATINCKMCPQWINVAALTLFCSETGETIFAGSAPCWQVCAVYGLSSGTDSNGKMCTSSENPGGGDFQVGRGSGTSARCVCYEDVGCDMYGSNCWNNGWVCSSALWVACYNNGQKHDDDATDSTNDCYCL